MKSDAVAVLETRAAPSRRTTVMVILLIAAIAIVAVLLVQGGFIFAADPMAGT